MLRIGDFSKLSRISVRMLRYYDELGLLKPVSVDNFTGYRYYDKQQLSDAAVVNQCREMGLSIYETVKYLSLQSPAEKSSLLNFKIHDTKNQIACLKTQLLLLEKELELFGKEADTMEYKAELKSMPAHFAASVRMVIPAYEYEGKLWHYLMSETKQYNIPQGGMNTAILHDMEYKEENADVEIQLTVDKLYKNTEHVVFKEIKPFDYVSVLISGSYSHIAEANLTAAKWAEENGFLFDGPAFNIYHVSPHETQNPDEWVTEVCIPVKHD